MREDDYDLIEHDGDIEDAIDRRMASVQASVRERPVHEVVGVQSADGDQDSVKKADDESKVMNDTLRPQLPLAPALAAVHIEAIERRLMAARAVRLLRVSLTQADADPETAMVAAEDIILRWRLDLAVLEEEATPPVAATMPAASSTPLTVNPQQGQRP